MNGERRFQFIKLLILDPLLIVFTHTGHLFAKPEVKTESGISCQN